MCPRAHRLCLNDQPGEDGSYFRCVPVGEACHAVPPTIPSQPPESSPSPLPEASPSPEPSPTPAPSPSPTPEPSPSASPATGGPPPLTASGNYPLPPAGTCPVWFRAIPFTIHIKTTTKECGEGLGCIKYNHSATQRVGKPGLEHTCYDEDGHYLLSNCKAVGEMLRACQLPQYVDYLGDGDNPGGGIYMAIFGPGVAYGKCDKWSCTSGCPPEMTN